MSPFAVEPHCDLVSAAAMACCGRLRRKRQDAFADVLEYPEVSFGQLEQFSLHELQVATDNFSYKKRLPLGGFTRVFEGRLADGTLVAVKRLAKNREFNQHWKQSFWNEIEFSNMAFHRNLLRLRGFCIIKTELMLVYPYMANGSLASRLRERSEDQDALDWSIRKRIALGSARGLAYMHNHCEVKVIHRDVKAANIFLDEEFEPVVGDFGLAGRIDHKETHVTSAVCGTIGHIAPEYLSTGKFSDKTDVFGYGVMLLELITGQRAFDLARLAYDHDVCLLDWVKVLFEDRRLEEIIDVNMQGNYNTNEVEQMIQVALLCTQNSPIRRPKMLDIPFLLEGYGLAERWEELLENVRYLEAASINNSWILDSTDNLQAETLSGPR